jgi:hypothetical protein
MSRRPVKRTYRVEVYRVVHSAHVEKEETPVPVPSASTTEEIRDVMASDILRGRARVRRTRLPPAEEESERPRGRRIVRAGSDA